MVLGNAITSVGQQLSLIPVVLAWALHGDKVDQRVGMLDAVIAVLQHPDIQGALMLSENMTLLEGGIAPLCSVLEFSHRCARLLQGLRRRRGKRGGKHASSLAIRLSVLKLSQ